jgi:hypothetical protein
MRKTSNVVFAGLFACLNLQRKRPEQQKPVKTDIHCFGLLVAQLNGELPKILYKVIRLSHPIKWCA